MNTSANVKTFPPSSKSAFDVSLFEDVPFTRRTHCMVCESPMQEAVIALPRFPMTEIYAPQKLTTDAGRLDQEFHLCETCGHAQLARVIDVELQYGYSFSYHFRTSESATGRDSTDFFVEFFDRVTKGRRFNTVVEMGCNDLHLLRTIRHRAGKLIGIDPVLRGREEEFAEENITAIGDFFENVKLDESLDLVICKDTLEHVADPKNFVRKVVQRGTEETLFFFQFPYLETLLEGCRFDQIFHQHLNYFSLRSIVRMLDELGCTLLDYTINYNLWGSILIVFKKGRDVSGRWKSRAREITPEEISRRYQVFKQDMGATAGRLKFLKEERIFGYGAALMLPVLSYHLHNDLSQLECVLDDDPRKAGMYYINLPVEIRQRRSEDNFSDAVVMLTAIASLYNTRRILAKLAELNPKQIIVPLNTL